MKTCYYTDEFRKQIEERFRSDSEPGVCARIVRNGQSVFTCCRGLSRLKQGCNLTETTNFRLASVTKQFTAATVLILCERGELRLTDTLCDFFSDFPPYGRSVTLKDLLQHTSGLLNYESLIPAGRSIPLTDRDVLELMKQQKGTYFEPGSQFRYSNTGYAVLALIVEHISRESFDSFLFNEIFHPLGMTKTVAYVNGKNHVENRAYGYRPFSGGYVDADQGIATSVLGDGGVYCSICDYVKWDHALYQSFPLRAKALQQAFKPGTLRDGTTIPYGFGWRLRTAGPFNVVYHTGSTSGFNNCVSRIPELQATCIILSNRNGTETHELAREWELLTVKEVERVGC